MVNYRKDLSHSKLSGIAVKHHCPLIVNENVSCKIKHKSILSSLKILSPIYRPCIKPVWSGWTISGKTFFILCAMHFARTSGQDSMLLIEIKALWVSRVEGHRALSDGHRPVLPFGRWIICVFVICMDHNLGGNCVSNQWPIQFMSDKGV